MNEDGLQKHSEMIDLTVKGESHCSNWAEIPKGLVDATSGLIEDTVLICGGYDLIEKSSSDECYSLSGEEATVVTHMSVKRRGAASLVLNDKILWITGGNYKDEILHVLSSSEFVKIGESLPGPSLQIPLTYHAMVAFNNSCSMFIGGFTDIIATDQAYRSTFFYNHKSNSWSEGPSLWEERIQHAAGVVTDEFTNEKLIVTTGGMIGTLLLDSIEVLFENQWHIGKELAEMLILCLIITIKLRAVDCLS